VSSLASAFIILACMIAGMVFGMLLRRRLPEHHIRDDSKEIVKTAAGMMATLVALVIGLLVSSAKSSFDTINGNITQAGAKIITLDRALARYGPDAKPVREQLKQNVTVGMNTIWPVEDQHHADMMTFETATGMEDLTELIRDLKPKTEAQQNLKAQALQQAIELAQARWLSIEQAQSNLPTVFLFVLVFWLTVLFTSFGLMAPINTTAIAALFISAVSMAGAVFLILELNRPLDGTIKVSSAPMQKALSLIGK
jgi:hypothetical protein